MTRRRGEDNPNPNYGFVTLGPVTPDETIVRERGLCVSHEHPEWWTSDSDVRVPRPHWLRAGWRNELSASYVAKKLCLTCPVWRECRRAVDAIEAELPDVHNVRAGIWAGEGPHERLIRQRRERGEANRRAA